MRIIKKFKYHLTFLIVIIIVINCILIKRNLQKQKYNIVQNEEELTKKTEENTNDIPVNKELCNIDIKGAVKNPGVYKIDCNKNVNDVIIAAGDITDNADTSLINLAKKVTDEMVIIVYTKDEVQNYNNNSNSTIVTDKECQCPSIKNDSCINNQENNDLININTATLEEIKELPKIGEAKAKAIIEYRETIGKFKSIEDLLNVKGIGEKLYEEIKIYITT